MRRTKDEPTFLDAISYGFGLLVSDIHWAWWHTKRMFGWQPPWRD